MAKLISHCGFAMVFDLTSFLAGVAAGALTGALAGILHGLENTADLQERLRQVTKEVEKINSTLLSSPAPDSDRRNAKLKVDQLYRDLEEIQEEIRRMYKKTAR